MAEVDWEDESGRWPTPEKATCFFLLLVIDWDCLSLGCEYQILVVPWFSAIVHGGPAIFDSI